METNFICKNKVDDNYIRQTETLFNSLRYTTHKFLNRLSKQANQFFIQCGYLPDNEVDANNFLNSIARINEKEIYDIDYAFKNIPDDKKFKLSKYTAVNALYPSVWINLAVEDKMVCLNFIYRNLCEKRNIKTDYRIVWVDEDNGSKDNAFVNNVKRIMYLGFDNVLQNNKYCGLEAVSLLAHEVNHMLQFEQADYIAKTYNFDNLNTYEQALSSNNALIMALDYNNNYLDVKHQLKYNKIKDTKEWKQFLMNIYFGDYLEISSGNIQRKEFLNFAKESYAFFDSDPLQDPVFLSLNDCLKTKYNKDIGEEIFGNLDEMNKLKTLCGLVEHNIDNLCFTRWQANKLNDKERFAVCRLISQQEDKLTEIQQQVFCALIDTFENNNTLPEDFDRSLFNKIPDMMRQKQLNVDTLLEVFLNKVKADEEEQIL